MAKNEKAILDVVISSLQVADCLGKRHDHILRAIQNAIPVNGFFETSYKDGKGQMRPMYMMNRDGFCFLILSATGDTTAKWKRAFIEVFNRTDAKSFENMAVKEGAKWRTRQL